MQRNFAFVPGLLLSVAAAAASERTVTPAIATDTGTGTGPTIGTVRIVETAYGVAFHPTLAGLPPGQHGFHLHDKPSCAPSDVNGVKTPAGGAGGHFDPASSGRHGEPWGDGHLGDLPPLFVAADGTATSPVLAPRLKIADVGGHALMVHVGGDNHADHPAPLGGGGARLACGVVAG